ncbi:MAG TPA: transcriptional repressor LexA [Patescibacteria group bacterium]|nr:transcriptional repressor LexA [Patescibacteria group bacterium]
MANTPKTGLTKRQGDVLYFLKKRVQSEGMPPTIQEICTEFGFASTNGVSEILKALEKKGFLKRIAKGSSRGIQLTEPMQKMTASSAQNSAPSFLKNVTIIGSGTAENPLSVFLSPEGQIAIDTRFYNFSGQVFAAIIPDDSMRDDGLLKGDTTIILQNTEPENGKIVVALVHDQTYFRKLLKTSTGMELHAAAKGYPKMRFEEGDLSLAILGEVIGILRKF